MTIFPNCAYCEAHASLIPTTQSPRNGTESGTKFWSWCLRRKPTQHKKAPRLKPLPTTHHKWSQIADKNKSKRKQARQPQLSNNSKNKTATTNNSKQKRLPQPTTTAQQQQQHRQQWPTPLPWLQQSPLDPSRPSRRHCLQQPPAKRPRDFTASPVTPTTPMTLLLLTGPLPF